MNPTRTLLGCVMVVAVGCGAKTPLWVPDVYMDAAMIADDGPIEDDGARPEVVVPPTNIDCTQRSNCNHAMCRGAAVCAAWVPGGCPPGQVHDAVSNQCRDCTSADCDGLPSFCCITRACANAAACGLFVCAPIASSCGGRTSTECGIYDIDQDDAWGDCDEAVRDVCCACHVAVGCSDSACMLGHYVFHNRCVPCTSSDCDEVSCMGLNGCPTNCPQGQFFDGAHCRPCSTSNGEPPACRLR